MNKVSKCCKVNESRFNTCANCGLPFIGVDREPYMPTQNTIQSKNECKCEGYCPCHTHHGVQAINCDCGKPLLPKSEQDVVQLSKCCNAEIFYYNHLPDFPKCKKCGAPFHPRESSGECTCKHFKFGDCEHYECNCVVHSKDSSDIWNENMIEATTPASTHKTCTLDEDGNCEECGKTASVMKCTCFDSGYFDKHRKDCKEGIPASTDTELRKELEKFVDNDEYVGHIHRDTTVEEMESFIAEKIAEAYTEGESDGEENQFTAMINNGWTQGKQSVLSEILAEMEKSLDYCDCGLYNKTHISELKCPGQDRFNNAVFTLREIIRNKMK